MEDFKIELTKHLEKFSTAPYLFIGSGFSRRYLELETWSELLSKMITTLNIPKEYNYYGSKCNNNNPQIASFISADLHESWWSDDRFSESRKQFSNSENQTIASPLKFEISKYLASHRHSSNPDYEEELGLLAKSNIDGIITTNWDNLLEQLFPEFNTYIGQEELLFLNQINIGEIYKIHGCISSPNSLILTKEDYDDFEKKNAYLAAKLLTIFVEHPIIFIGYSVSDENIIKILTSIVSCLNNKNIERLQDRLIIIQRDASSPRLEDSTILLTENKTPFPVKTIKTNSFKEVFEVLGTTRRRLPIKVLRHMKNMVYDYVKNNNPSHQILISEDLTNESDISKIEYYFGIGVKDRISALGIKGYEGLQAKDILKDILNDLGLNNEEVIRSVIPSLLKSTTYLPIFKYLKLTGKLDMPGRLDTSGLSKSISDKYKKLTMDYFLSKPYLKKESEIRRNHNSVKSIVQNFDILHSIYFIPLLEKKSINLDDLHSFLINQFEQYHNNTYYKKLVCLYDYYKYGN